MSKDNTDDTTKPDTSDNSSTAAPVIPDVSAFEAKIESLTADLTAKDVEISTLSAELKATKSANYDLIMAAPGNSDSVESTLTNPIDDETDVDISDLFGKD